MQMLSQAQQQHMLLACSNSAFLSVSKSKTDISGSESASERRKRKRKRGGNSSVAAMYVCVCIQKFSSKENPPNLFFLYYMLNQGDKTFGFLCNHHNTHTWISQWIHVKSSRHFLVRRFCFSGVFFPEHHLSVQFTFLKLNPFRFCATCRRRRRCCEMGW